MPKPKAQHELTESRVLSLFDLAGIETGNVCKLANRYWPDAEDYRDLHQKSPWWLVITEHGPFVVGWRKRVISIDWGDTDLEVVVTDDEVTKDEKSVHAWGYGKAVQYLTAFQQNASQF